MTTVSRSFAELAKTKNLLRRQQPSVPSVNLKIEKLEETSEAKVELKTDLINNFIEDGDFYL